MYRYLSAFPAIRAVAMLIALSLAGCGGDARLQLVTAEALEVIAEQQRQAIDEYHADILSLDDERESGVVEAFITRVERDVVTNPDALDGHASAFREALSRIRADRDVEYARHRAASNNADALVEVADGLRQTAVESMTLQDELRRYVNGLIEARRQALQEVTDAQ
jgi:hypothetical protein